MKGGSQPTNCGILIEHQPDGISDSCPLYSFPKHLYRRNDDVPSIALTLEFDHISRFQTALLDTPRDDRTTPTDAKNVLDCHSK